MAASIINGPAGIQAESPRAIAPPFAKIDLPQIKCGYTRKNHRPHGGASPQGEPGRLFPRLGPGSFGPPGKLGYRGRGVIIGTSTVPAVLKLECGQEQIIFFATAKRRDPRRTRQKPKAPKGFGGKDPPRGDWPAGSQGPGGARSGPLGPGSPPPQSQDGPRPKKIALAFPFCG
jgi:hypothetical protein